MRRFEVGDRVRIDIPDKDDPDYERLHRKHGTIVEIFEDDAGQETGTHVTHIYLASKLVTAQPNTFDGETSDLPQIHNNATNCVTPKHEGATITVLLF